MRTLAAVLVCCGLAAAQDSSLQEKLQKQMEEISRLMRDSEGKLLEMTRVDAIVETQGRIVEELEKLLKETPPNADAAREREERRQELERQQQEIARKLQEIFEGQRKSAKLTVEQLEELLRSLPRQRHGQGQQDDRQKQQRQKQDRQKRLRNEQNEQTQEDPAKPREKREERRDRRTAKRTGEDTEAAARLRRIEAWIARLPPEDQERINRNDFSTIPPRYQRLVREYTALRAQREAKEEKDR